MENVKAFLQRKNIVISAKRYGIDALGAMAQGLFCSLPKAVQAVPWLYLSSPSWRLNAAKPSARKQRSTSW